MALSPQNIASQARFLRSKNERRNRYQEDVLALSEGRWDDVFPGMFPPEWDRPAVANLIAIAAEDMSQVLGPLPNFECLSAEMKSDRARAFAAKRTKVANYYAYCSNLQSQMYSGTHRLVSFGFMAFAVEPEFDAKMPKIRVENNFRAYYQLDAFGAETLVYCRIFRKDIDELIREFPDSAEALLGQKRRKSWDGTTTQMVEVVRWYDKDQQALVVLDSGILLQRVENPLSRCPIRVVELPHLGDTARGLYDDAVGVQGARAQSQVYAFQGMDESVNAPYILPDDVQELPMGPKAIIRTATPQGAGRLNLQIPPGVFAEVQNTDRELHIATRHGEARSGSIDASIITGQGVEALQGMFNTQLRTAQNLLEIGLQAVMELCFEADEYYFGNVSKSVRGKTKGSRYDLTYVPSRDIGGDYSIDVTYGTATGLDPNRHLIWAMQANAGKLLSRSTIMRELPVNINVDEEMTLMDVEQLRDTLTASLAATAQAIPMMATNGMDPTAIVAKLAEITRQRQKGKPIEEVAAAAFAPPPPAPEAEGAAPAAEDPLAALMGGGGGQPGGMPGGPPQDDLLMSLAGLTPGGNANLQSNVSRRQPI